MKALKLLLHLQFRIDLDLVDKVLGGQEAVDLVVDDFLEQGQSSYALVFMDCNMPFKDGYEATDEIRNFLHFKRVPIRS